MGVKVGLIGAGGITRPHLAAFVRHTGVDRVAVADPSQQARAGLMAEFGIIREQYDDYRALLEDDSVSIIDICTPHYLHVTQAVDALRAGKDVIIEKPLAMSVRECDEMIAAAQESGRRLLCALCMRRFPAHIKAKKLLDEGAVGKPLMGMVTVIGNEFARMNDPENWKGDWEKAGGGAMFDTGYHAVYMLQHFFGPTKAVTMTGTRLLVEAENKADDTSVVALEMESGVLCSIVVTYVAIGDRWSEERRLLGTEGSLLIRDDPEDELPLLLLQGGDYRPIRVRNAPGVARFAIRELVSEFVDCLLTGGETDVTLAESRAAVATCCAAYESWRTGRRVEIAG